VAVFIKDRNSLSSELDRLVGDAVDWHCCADGHTAGGGLRRETKSLLGRRAIFEAFLLDAGQRGSPDLCG